MNLFFLLILTMSQNALHCVQFVKRSNERKLQQNMDNNCEIMLDINSKIKLYRNQIQNKHKSKYINENLTNSQNKSSKKRISLIHRAPNIQMRTHSSCESKSAAGLLKTTPILCFDSKTKKTQKTHIRSLHYLKSSLHPSPPHRRRNIALSINGNNTDRSLYKFKFWETHSNSPLAIRYYLPLMEALRNENVSTTKQLLQIIANDSSSKVLHWLSTLEDDSGNTFAHCAALCKTKKNARSMLGLLCKFGVHLNSANNENLTPLDIVALHGDAQWIRELIQMGGSSYICPQEIFNMNDESITKWLKEYQEAIKSKGYEMQKGHCDKQLVAQQGLKQHPKFLKRRRNDSKLGLNGNRSKRIREKLKLSNLDLGQEIVRDLIIALDDDDGGIDSADTKRKEMMTRIKKKIQMEAKSKKKKKSVHRIATLSTCFAYGEQTSSFKPYASRPQTSGSIKTNNSKIIIDERPNTYVSVLYLLVPPVVLFFCVI